MRIGILSDTHGLLRREVTDVLQSCDAIVHGGDINNREILEQLERMAPLYIVRGNNDKEWAEGMAEEQYFQLGGLDFYMVHKKKHVPDPVPKVNVIVFGHSHRYSQETKDGILWLNPGSCGPRRFGQPITMAVMTVEAGCMEVEKLEFEWGE